MTQGSTVPRRRAVVGRRLAFALVAYAFAVTMLGTTLPTPLYPIYQARMGFSELIVNGDLRRVRSRGDRRPGAGRKLV